MERRFAKVSEEEIVAINEAPFFYPSDLVNTKTTVPSGSVKSGGYIPRCFTSLYISTTIHLPFRDSCIIIIKITTVAYLRNLQKYNYPILFPGPFISPPQREQGFTSFFMFFLHSFTSMVFIIIITFIIIAIILLRSILFSFH